MAPIQKVAVFGASGSLGTPITSALVAAGFTVTIITRPASTAEFPPGLPVTRTEYSVPALTTALRGHDAVVSAVGVPGNAGQKDMMDAAEAAGVGLFLVSDFGYAPDHDHVPETDAVGKPRRQVLEYARQKAASNPRFTWAAIAIGHPFDRVLKKFPTFGFDIANRRAIIYDSGTERFTATTLAGIASAVVGVLRHAPDSTNRHLLVRSVETCQNEVLAAFETATGEKWPVTHATAADLLARGREKLANGDGSWTLDIIVGQLFEEGKNRSIVVAADKADNGLLGMPEENLLDIVRGVVQA